MKIERKYLPKKNGLVRGYHHERIECPYCHQKQTAMVVHTETAWHLNHSCITCKNNVPEEKWIRFVDSAPEAVSN